MPRPLLSEALRGHGALLRDAHGERFVDELGPRDVVARAMASRMGDQGVDHLWLDATVLEDFDRRFPTIAAAVRAAGLDPTTEWLPVAPAAHYFIGGIVTDTCGATAVPGLWAAGEAACTGVHGANRLGSNSLLEGMVFAARTVEAIDEGRRGPEPTGLMRAVLDGDSIRLALEPPDHEAAADTADLAKRRLDLQRSMTEHAGVVRSATTLAGARLGEAITGGLDRPDAWEIRNLTVVGRALVAAATAREESRGAHSRTDFPDTSPAFARRIVVGGG
jgi:L-aspartate oxidase